MKKIKKLNKLINLQIERFIEQIKAKEIALSGKQFFLLTRKLLLGVRPFIY